MCSFPWSCGTFTHSTPWAGLQWAQGFILEVAPDVAEENTIVLIVPESGLGQPFPGTESLGRDRTEARGQQEEGPGWRDPSQGPRAASGALQTFFWLEK